MEEKDQEHIARPGIPEALDPALGNGALWETDPQFLNLRLPDPLKKLDNLLLDEDTTQKILYQWNGSEQDHQIENPAIELYEEITLNAADPSDITEPKTKPVISRNKVKKTVEIEWAEDELPPENESEDPNSPDPEDIIEATESLPEEKPAPPAKVGKRVRKVVKKARDEAELIRESEQPGPDPESGDHQLSPYTRWLKGLRGSEYIHPYEDDYGLDQMSVTSRGGVSETFADLLAAQGYKDKAIEMYLQLMEKYPEKSSFFAAKIEAFK
ncbi:MAG TPA: hypothetical protein VFG10_19485 [Saprospiraceae bacterium]|nr:hypothetical protein [Saprospiraceae bacterium]